MLSTAGSRTVRTAGSVLQKATRGGPALAAITGEGGPAAAKVLDLTGSRLYQQAARQGRPKASNTVARNAIEGRANSPVRQIVLGIEQQLAARGQPTVPVRGQPTVPVRGQPTVPVRGQPTVPVRTPLNLYTNTAKLFINQGKLAEAQARVQAAEESLARAEAEKQTAINQAVETVRTQLQSNIAARNATIANLQQQLVNRATAAEAAQSSEVAATRAAANAEKQAAINAIKAEYEQRMQQLQSKLISKSAANAGTKTTQLRDLRSQMNTRIKQVEAAKQAEIEAAIQGSQREMKTAFEAQLAEARGQVGPIQSQLEAAEGRVRQLESNKQALTQQVEQLTGNLATARGRSAELNGVTKNQATRLTESVGRIQQLEGQLAEARGRASELNATKQSRNVAEQKVQELTADLAKEKQIMQSRVNQLAKNSETMKSEVAKAKQEAEEEVMKTFDQALQNSKIALRAAEKEAMEAKEYAARAKEDATKELTEQLEEAYADLQKGYLEELEAAKREMERLRRTVNTVDKSKKLKDELDEARKYMANLQASKKGELDSIRAQYKREIERQKTEFDSLLQNARANAESAKRLAHETEQELQRLRQGSTRSNTIIRTEPVPPNVIVPVRPPLVNIGTEKQKPGLLLQKIGKRQLETNPIIVNNLQKKLEKVDSTQSLYLIADSISCRDISKLLKDTTVDINAYRAVEEGPETTISDLGINLALKKREDLKQQIMDYVLIAPTIKSIQTAILIYGTHEEIFEFFPSLKSKRSSISHRFNNPKMFLIDASVIPGEPGGSKGLFTKYPRDPSFDRLAYSDLQTFVSNHINLSYLQKIPINYSYNRLLTIITEFVRKSIEDKTYGYGQIALIVQPNVMKDIYMSHTTNRDQKPIGPNQPYHCESWNTTFDLAAADKAITINEIMLPSNQIGPGSLSFDQIWSYGKICKWPYKSTLHGTRKRGGRRGAQTRRR